VLGHPFPFYRFSWEKKEHSILELDRFQSDLSGGSAVFLPLTEDGISQLFSHTRKEFPIGEEPWKSPLIPLYQNVKFALIFLNQLKKLSSV
jgi:hypothetical protein